MIAIQTRQYLSVITTTGADIHVSATYRPSSFGRGHTQNKLTSITAAVASPGTAILGKFADATSPASPDSGQVGFEVENLTIRNIDTTSQTVTVCIVEADDAGTQTVYQLWKETIATGQELVYESGAGWALQTHNTIGVWATVVLAADLLNTADDVLANVLTYPVTSGYVYEFVAEIPYTADATTTGSRWTANGPAITWAAYESEYALTATTKTFNNAAAWQVPAAANATSAATAGNIARLTGMFKPSADGTFAIQNAAENTGGANDITALAGATLMIRRVL